MNARIKKVIAILLTAIMVLAMAIQSFAAPLSYAKPAAVTGNEKVAGTWSKDAAGNWHFNSQSGAAKGGWYYLNITNKSTEYNWFCFDANGVMKTGWVQDKKDPSVWYYTGEIKDSSEGGLVKGWVTDPHDGKRYYTDPSTGIMCYGWKQLDGVWYYFGEKQYANASHPYGAMYVNEKTPDGYYVGSSGAWRQNTSSGGNSRKPTPVATYTVTFDMQGHGTQIPQRTGVTSGSKITAPTAPTADGYTFGGWYKEAACTNAWNFGTDKVTANTTLYAKWILAVEINTVADVLATVEDFPTSNNGMFVPATAWTAENGQKCYRTTDVLCFNNPASFGLKSIGLSGKVVKSGNNYICNYQEGLTVTFHMTNDVLTSITFTNEGSIFDGTYKAPTPVTSVSLSLTELNLQENDTWKLTATITPENATEKGVNWRSSDTSVASVDGNGKVTAKSIGTAIITATTVDGGKTAACTVNVGGSIVEANYTLEIGATWFNKLASGTGTDINKDKISKIIFRSATPSEVEGSDGVDITANNTQKVKGYLVLDNDNYKIYIVGDYIFGNTDCQKMFMDFSNLKTLDFGNFDTSNVTVMVNMFSGCSGLTSLNLSSFDTSKVSYMNSMFSGCSGLTSLDLSSFDTSETLGMMSMFSGCSKLESITFGTNFSTSKVTSMVSMFNGCSALESLDLSSFDTSAVSKMNSMFQDCSTLKSLDFGSFNTEKVSGMASMFNGCSALKSLDLSKFDTSEVTDMNGMFTDCSSLESITFGTNFNTSKVTAMNIMFRGCSALKSLDLSSFDTLAVTKMQEMFNNCSILESLDLSNFTVGDTTNRDNLFNGCSMLTSVKIDTENEKIKNSLETDTEKAWNYENGFFVPVPAPKTLAVSRPQSIGNIIGDTIPTLASPDDAVYDGWNSNDSAWCFLSDEENSDERYLVFYDLNDSISINLKKTAAKVQSEVALEGEEIYKHESKDYIIYFNMIDGNLDSIEFVSKGDTGSPYDGIYRAPEVVSEEDTESNDDGTMPDGEPHKDIEPEPDIPEIAKEKTEEEKLEDSKEEIPEDINQNVPDGEVNPE